MTITVGTGTARNYSFIENELISLSSDICTEYQRVIICGRTSCTETYGSSLKTCSFMLQLYKGSIAAIQSFLFDPIVKHMYMLCKLQSVKDKHFVKSIIFIINHYCIISPLDTIAAVMPSDIAMKVIFLGGTNFCNSYLVAL